MITRVPKTKPETFSETSCPARRVTPSSDRVKRQKDTLRRKTNIKGGLVRIEKSEIAAQDANRM
jgi:hypothetical protein